MSHRRLLMAVACALTIGGTACSDDPVSPADIPGTYTATSFRVTTNGTTTDILQAGGTVTIQLLASGTTTGRIHVPPVAGQPAFDADLSGTWSITNGSVRLQHNADTFLRDMDLVADDEHLIGDRAFGAVQIRIELTKN